MDLSIIVVAYNIKDIVEECLSKVASSKDKLEKEVIFVDNGSTDGTAEMIEAKFPWAKVVRAGENLGFVKANNLAYSKAHGKYILMLNADLFIGDNTLQNTVDFMEHHPECGVLGCRLISRDGVLQPSARYFPTPWKLFLLNLGISGIFPGVGFLRGIDDLSWDYMSIRETDWVPGAFLLVRKDIIDEEGYLLESKFFMYHEDDDLCRRVKKRGAKVFFYPENVVHLGGENSRRIGSLTADNNQILQYALESEFIYFRKHDGLIYVLLDLFFISLADSLNILKAIFKKKNTRSISDISNHFKLAWDMALKTKYGNIPAH